MNCDGRNPTDPPPRVVVIDADQAMRLSCRKILAEAGLEVETFEDGVEGWYALDHREQFRRITLMCGARTPGDMLFGEELSSLADRADMSCLLTVDADPTGSWKHHIGLLPSLFDRAALDPPRTYAAVCGPPVVYRFILGRLLELGFSKDRILMSLERRMKCGIGKCGHCLVGYKYTCLDGPIFTYWDAINLPEMI